MYAEDLPRCQDIFATLTKAFEKKAMFYAVLEGKGGGWAEKERSKFLFEKVTCEVFFNSVVL